WLVGWDSLLLWPVCSAVPARLLPSNDGVLARSDDARRPPAVSATRSLNFSAAIEPMPLARLPVVPAARLTARFAPLSELPPNPAAWANGLLPALPSPPLLVPVPLGLLFDIPPMLGISLPLDIEACALSNAALMAEPPPARSAAPPMTAEPATLAAPAAIPAAPITAPTAAPVPKLPMPPADPMLDPVTIPATIGGTRLTSDSNAMQNTNMTPSSSKLSTFWFILV